MPTEGRAWRHIVISTVNSWLPGDPRGFRAEDHKIHSSGDYKNPPPEGEHEGLHRYSRKLSEEAVIIPKNLLETVGRRIVKKLKEHEHRVLVVSVSITHSHWLVELPDSIPAIRKIVGQCKTAASHSIRERLPGRVWGRHGSFKLVDSQEYHRKVYRYILTQKDAWIWSYKDDDEHIDLEA
ncbi:MAG: hypothetical protein EXS16_18850 [Gemmataceae bacterium]|nr:hypothetical protein [Gemmataceae bacterium]